MLEWCLWWNSRRLEKSKLSKANHCKKQKVTAFEVEELPCGIWMQGRSAQRVSGFCLKLSEFSLRISIIFPECSVWGLLRESQGLAFPYPHFFLSFSVLCFLFKTLFFPPNCRKIADILSLFYLFLVKFHGQSHHDWFFFKKSHFVSNGIFLKKVWLI